MNGPQVPVNTELERLLVGGLLSEIRLDEKQQKTGAFEPFANTPDDVFSNDIYRLVFRAIKNLYISKRPYDIPAMTEYLREQVGVKSIMINDKEQTPQTNISLDIQNEWGSFRIR